MKKTLFSIVAMMFLSLNLSALAQNDSNGDNIENSFDYTNLLAYTTILYDGPAYCTGEGTFIPKAGGSVNVKWTSEGCWINGQEASLPGTVRDGFMMYVNGKCKTMNYYVTYRGEKYFFQR